MPSAGWRGRGVAEAQRLTNPLQAERRTVRPFLAFERTPPELVRWPPETALDRLRRARTVAQLSRRTRRGTGGSGGSRRAVYERSPRSDLRIRSATRAPTAIATSPTMSRTICFQPNPPLPMASGSASPASSAATIPTTTTNSAASIRRTRSARGPFSPPPWPLPTVSSPSWPSPLRHWHAAAQGAHRPRSASIGTNTDPEQSGPSPRPPRDQGLGPAWGDCHQSAAGYLPQ